MLTFFSAEKLKTEQKAHKPFWHHFLSKSILGFEKWTKKMSKIENPNHFCAKNRALTEARILLFGNIKIPL